LEPPLLPNHHFGTSASSSTENPQSSNSAGYDQWKDAMKMVARLPEGVPTEFRRRVRKTFF